MTLLFSVEDIKIFSFKVLCKEIHTTVKIIRLFNEHGGHPRNEQEKLWQSEFRTLEDVEELEKSFLLLKIKARNILDEINFSKNGKMRKVS